MITDGKLYPVYACIFVSLHLCFRCALVYDSLFGQLGQSVLIGIWYQINSYEKLLPMLKYTRIGNRWTTDAYFASFFGRDLEKISSKLRYICYR